MMFWRGRNREDRDQNGIGGPPVGQVRVLVVGDSGVGKTSLVHLIVKGSPLAHPSPTVGCQVGVKHITCASSGSSSNSINGDAERGFFVELWDISGHERYKDCRSLFYTQINGVIFVHDLSQRRTKTSLQKWAIEIAIAGTFSAPLGTGGPGGLPVPYLVIANKTDIAAEGNMGSSGNLVDAARQWVEKQGLLPSSAELPLTESFPGSTGLLALIKRRYFSREVPAQSLWPMSSLESNVHRSDEITSEDDQLFPKVRSLTGEAHSYNTVPPLPTQHSLSPPVTLYPQQPVSTPDNYGYHRYSSTTSLSDIGTRTRRSDINV